MHCLQQHQAFFIQFVDAFFSLVHAACSPALLTQRSTLSTLLAALLWPLQDVEKLAARKGVVLQSIKEVLQVSCKRTYQHAETSYALRVASADTALEP
jgi:hypothetical protein